MEKKPKITEDKASTKKFFGNMCFVPNFQGGQIEVDCGMAESVKKLLMADHVTKSSCSSIPSEHKFQNVKVKPYISLAMPGGEKATKYAKCMGTMASLTDLNVVVQGNALFIESKKVPSSEKEANQEMNKFRIFSNIASKCSQFLPWTNK